MGVCGYTVAPANASGTPFEGRHPDSGVLASAPARWAGSCLCALRAEGCGFNGRSRSAACALLGLPGDDIFLAYQNMQVT